MVSERVTRAWHREPYVWLLIAIPASAVVVGMIMLALALDTDDGLVADDYYKRGLEINWILARDEEAARLGLEADMHLSEVGSGGSREAAGLDISVSLDASARDFVTPASLVARFAHATRSGFDRQVSLTSRNGVYVGRIEPLAPGRWNVVLATPAWRLSASLNQSSTPAPIATRLHFLAPPAR